RWIVHRAHALQASIKADYEAYDFAGIVQGLSNFCSVDLGSLYLDVTKDRLYTMPEDSRGRRSAQTAMYHVAEAMVRWIAPILSFTADELWGYLPPAPGETTRGGNVLFATWYEGLQPLPADAPRAAGEIGAALEAEITLRADTAARAWLAPFVDELRFLLISGDVTVEEAPEAKGIAASAAPTGKAKCIRCWQHRGDVGSHAEHPQLCGRCVSNVEGPGETRRWF